MSTRGGKRAAKDGQASKAQASKADEYCELLEADRARVQADPYQLFGTRVCTLSGGWSRT